MDTFKITRDTTIEEVVMKFPQTVEIFFRHGIPAISCGSPLWGTIGENIDRYHVKDPEKLIEELQNAIASSSTVILTHPKEAHT